MVREAVSCCCRSPVTLVARECETPNVASSRFGETWEKKDEWKLTSLVPAATRRIWDGNPCLLVSRRCSTTPVSCNFRGQWKAEEDMAGPVLYIPLSKWRPSVWNRGALFPSRRSRRLRKWPKFQQTRSGSVIVSAVSPSKDTTTL